MNDCIFCKIVNGEIPAKKVFEDSSVLAFLDINPANPGHTLVIPKKHSEDITTISEPDLFKSIDVVKKVASKLKEKMRVEGVNIVQNNGRVAGQLVNHIHFHVIPRFQGDHVIISYAKTQISEQEMDTICKNLAEEKQAIAPPRKDMDLEF
jgi:histidine triad (HIT) family protein